MSYQTTRLLEWPAVKTLSVEVRPPPFPLSSNRLHRRSLTTVCSSDLRPLQLWSTTNCRHPPHRPWSTISYRHLPRRPWSIISYRHPPLQLWSTTNCRHPPHRPWSTTSY